MLQPTHASILSNRPKPLSHLVRKHLKPRLYLPTTVRRLGLHANTDALDEVIGLRLVATVDIPHEEAIHRPQHNNHLKVPMANMNLSFWKVSLLNGFVPMSAGFSAPGTLSTKQRPRATISWSQSTFTSM